MLLARRATWALVAILCWGCGKASTTAKLPASSSLSPMTSPSGPGSGEGRFCALHDGLLFSWIEGTGASRRLLMSTWQGNTWSPPETIVQGKDLLANGADFPTVLELAHENHTLLAAFPWSTGPESYEIRISVSQDRGKSWSVPQRLHRDASLAEHGFASLVRHGDGAEAFWLGPGSSKAASLRTAEVRWDGKVEGETEIDDRVCDCCQTSAIELASAGTLVVAYRDRSADEIRDIRVWRDDIPMAASTTVHADGWKIPGCPVNGPQIAADGGGGFAAAWFTAAADSPRVFASFGDPHGKYSAPMRLDSGRPVGRVSVTMVNHDWALATWVEMLNDSTASFDARLVSASGQMSPTFSVAKMGAARGSGVPQVGRVNDQFFFAWREMGTNPGIRMATTEIKVP